MRKLGGRFGRMCAIFTRRTSWKMGQGERGKKKKKRERKEKKEERKIEIPAEQWKEYTVGVAGMCDRVYV